MRITTVRITGFGKWRQREFHFESGNQLLFGENEAGKSTLYQFILTMFFGFQRVKKGSPDYQPTDGTAFGGWLEFEHPVHGLVHIERFKQRDRGRATVSFGEQSGGEELLQNLLAPLNQKIFQQVFTFQQEQLSQLDELEEEPLHDALVALGISGSHEIFDVRQRYLQQAQKVYKRKGQKLPLNQRLKRYLRLQKKVAEREAQETDFNRLGVEEQQVTQEILALEEQAATLQQAELHLAQQKMNFKSYEERLALKPFANKHVLSVKEQDGLRDFYQEWQHTSRELEELRSRLAENSGRDQQSAQYFFYLENETPINDLLQQELAARQISQALADNAAQSAQVAEQLARGTKYGWQNQAPHPFVNQSELIENFQQQTTLEHLAVQEQLQVTAVKEENQRLEQALNQLEQAHPELVNGEVVASVDKRPFWVIAVLSVVGLIALPQPWRFVALIPLVISGYLALKKTPPKTDDVKAEWQEKLGQLDNFAKQVARLVKKQQQAEQKSRQYQQSFEVEVKRRGLPFKTELSDLLAVNQLAQTYLDETTQLAALRQQQRELTGQLAAFSKQFNFLTEWLPLAKEGVLRQFELLQAFKVNMEQLRFAESYRENTRLQQDINRLTAKQETLLNSGKQTLVEFNLHYPSEIPGFLQQQAELLHKQERYQELTTNLADLFPEKVSEMEIIEQSVTIKREQADVGESMKGLRETQQRKRFQLEQLQQDATLDELYQEEASQKSQILALAKEYGSEVVAADILRDLATELSQQQLPQLLQQASRYFQTLTNQQYDRLELAEGKIQVKRGLQSFSLTQLSTGTKDQLIMSIRFAYLYLEGQRSLSPIIIDDGWLHYDSRRKRQLAQLLAEFSEDFQIICLSSDQEMVSYYKEYQQSVWPLRGDNF